MSRCEDEGLMCADTAYQKREGRLDGSGTRAQEGRAQEGHIREAGRGQPQSATSPAPVLLNMLTREKQIAETTETIAGLDSAVFSYVHYHYHQSRHKNRPTEVRLTLGASPATSLWLMLRGEGAQGFATEMSVASQCRAICSLD